MEFAQILYNEMKNMWEVVFMVFYQVLYRNQP